MILDEAMAILKVIKGYPLHFYVEHANVAIDLGIEALERLRDVRQDSNFSGTFLVRSLPGETEK